jgi:hypothetical protein
MKKYATHFLCLTLLALFACAVTPQSYDQRVATAYATNTQARVTAASAVRSGLLSREEGTAVLGITDQIRVLLDEASDGDERGLDLAIELLEKLEEFIQ